MFVLLPEIHVKMLGMVKDACHPNSREAGAGGSPKFNDQFSLMRDSVSKGVDYIPKGGFQGYTLVIIYTASSCARASLHRQMNTHTYTHVRTRVFYTRILKRDTWK